MLFLTVIFKLGSHLSQGYNIFPHFAQFGPQTLDMGVHRPVVAVKIHIPYGIEDLVTAQYDISVLHKIIKQFKLLGGQCNALLIGLYFPLP
jgi:hypothetical protein